MGNANYLIDTQRTSTDRIGAQEVPLGVNLIGAVTLTSSSATVTIPSSGSIPNGYSSLQVTGYFRSDRSGQTADRISVQFNGDAGSNYDYTFASISNASITWIGSPNTAGAVIGQCPGPSAPASVFGAIFMSIPGHTQPRHKVLTSMFSLKTASGAGASIFTGTGAGFYQSGASIGSITFNSAFGANIVASSMIAVYGVY